MNNKMLQNRNGNTAGKRKTISRTFYKNNTNKNEKKLK